MAKFWNPQIENPNYALATISALFELQDSIIKNGFFTA